MAAARPCKHVGVRKSLTPTNKDSQQNCTAYELVNWTCVFNPSVVVLSSSAMTPLQQLASSVHLRIKKKQRKNLCVCFASMHRKIVGDSRGSNRNTLRVHLAFASKCNTLTSLWNEQRECPKRWQGQQHCGCKFVLALVVVGPNSSPRVGRADQTPNQNRETRAANAWSCLLQNLIRRLATINQNRAVIPLGFKKKGPTTRQHSSKNTCPRSEVFSATMASKQGCPKRNHPSRDTPWAGGSLGGNNPWA